VIARGGAVVVLVLVVLVLVVLVLVVPALVVPVLVVLVLERIADVVGAPPASEDDPAPEHPLMAAASTAVDTSGQRCAIGTP
jgi:hypothetical protein